MEINTNFLSLDFIYVPAKNFEAMLKHYINDLGGELIWKVKAMGTIVAQVKISENGPAILLAEHLEGKVPILIYRVKNFKQTLAKLKAKGIKGRELEIPHGSCFSFELSGQRLAIYELVRPEANRMFKGRKD